MQETCLKYIQWLVVRSEKSCDNFFKTVGIQLFHLMKLAPIKLLKYK